MSKLQEQGTFQTYISFYDIITKEGVVSIPLYLSGNYDLTVQQLDISSNTNVIGFGSSYKAPFLINISSPNISSSLSNVQGWMFQIPVTTRAHHYALTPSLSSENQVTERLQESILPSRQTFAASLSNCLILNFGYNQGSSDTRSNPIIEPLGPVLNDQFDGAGAIVITWAYKRI